MSLGIPIQKQASRNPLDIGVSVLKRRGTFVPKMRCLALLHVLIGASVCQGDQIVGEWASATVTWQSGAPCGIDTSIDILGVDARTRTSGTACVLQNLRARPPAGVCCSYTLCNLCGWAGACELFAKAASSGTSS